jgi:hypothetical protein
MNTIIKRASDILKNNRLTKSKKIVLENTIKFSKKYDVNIVDCRVDFLTIKIEKGKFIKTLEMDLYKIYSYDDIFDKTTNLEHIECKKTILNKFFIIFTGLAF